MTVKSCAKSNKINLEVVADSRVVASNGRVIERGTRLTAVKETWEGKEGYYTFKGGFTASDANFISATLFGF